MSEPIAVSPSSFRSFRLPERAAVAGLQQTPIDPTEFEDRNGYQVDFLGADFPVELPTLTSRQAADCARIIGSTETELRYQNFSIRQSKSRRMCYFSACNVNGKTSKKVPRSNSWRFDGRIDTRYQILDDCYGNERDGLFSRGHMTRREDPVHGPEAQAILAERDTFCVTNAVPQMQSHNSPVWLGLENYLLENSRDDRQRISVFTGPVFRKSDPELYGVKIPLTFWKVVAFLHDDTGELAAAAYRDSQAEFVPDVEPSFVFGAYKEMQVTVRAIENLTGFDFGVLADADVLRTADAEFALAVTQPSDSILR